MAELDPNFPLIVVTSYAHADQDYLTRFEKFWKPIREAGAIASWTDRGILAGQSWDSTIKRIFNEADVFIFLISSDALASDYINTVEMKIAFERRAAGEAEIIPIILRPCLWKYSAFKDLQLLPTDGKPVTTWDGGEDAAMLEVADGMARMIANLQARKKDKLFAR